MDPGGGQIAAAERADPSGEDRLSALPNDVLVLILLRLGTAAAGQTSVLSRRWRRVWALLPELRFPAGADARLVASALAAHEAPISYLDVGTLDSAPESVQACVAAAADRFVGRLIFRNRMSQGKAVERGTFVELPCLENATMVSLSLGCLHLVVPPAGVFARLTELCLMFVQFRGPCELGDAVSLPRCPCLQKLSVTYARGLANLFIHSESLLELDLKHLNGLQQLTVVAEELKTLTLFYSFTSRHPIANISATQLVSLEWVDWYDPASVQLDNLAQVQLLSGIINAYDLHENHPWFSQGFLRLLDRFQAIESLTIMLFYPEDIGNFPYLMEDITRLPRITFLTMRVSNKGHAFGPSLFCMLRLCTGIKRLSLKLHTGGGLESGCQLGCVCDQPTNWETEELSLNCLEEVEISNLKGVEHEVVFVKRLFSWGTVLKEVTITFDPSVSESQARELAQTLATLSTPGTLMEVYSCRYHID